MTCSITSASVIPDCIERLYQLPHSEQLFCLEPAKLADVSNATLANLLTQITSNTDHRVIAALLDVVRARGRAVDLAEPVARLLPHQMSIYQERDRWHVLRLRAYLFVTLADIGYPDSALPMLVDTLAYVDERMVALEFGSAVRAAGMLGDRGRPFIPHLLKAIGERFAEEEFSLNRYDLSFPPQEATTVQLEIVSALSRIGVATDRELVAVLRAITNSPEHSPLDRRLIAAAKLALPVIELRQPDVASLNSIAPNNIAAEVAEQDPYVTQWLEPAKRRRLAYLDVAVVDHEGAEHAISDLVDRPVLLTFFYTRCQNAGKCSMSVTRLAMLQKALEKEGIAGEVRLLALTFEPAFDTPARLKRFVQDRGLHLNHQAMTGRLRQSEHAAFVRDLDMPVSYSAGWVNTHGVEAVLLDAQGRLARKYKTITWDKAVVLHDFRNLLEGR